MTGGSGHAVVIGAGIGGLAAAIALRRAGLSVSVYEAAEEIRPLGAGLSIWPNGVRALRALGLGEVADAERAPIGGGALRRADGSVLAEFDPDRIAERYGAPLVGLHRGDLHRSLLDGLGEQRVRFGARLVELDGRELRFVDGSEARAEWIVGADGLHSVVRERLLGDGEPDDSGIVAFRGVSEADVRESAGEWWGEGSVAGLLPLAGGRVYWYVACRGRAEPRELERCLAGYGSPLSQTVRATPTEDVLCHRLFDRPAAQAWGRGAVTLLGDAAHPMLPFLGQGACSALEDAVALGAAVARSADSDAAVEVYERARLKRTASLVRRSRQAARLALARSAAARRLQNALVARTPEALRLRQLDRIVGRP